MSTLELTLLYLLAAVLGVVACRSLKLPPMLGYLVVGVVIGPNALALGENSDAVRYLGEFGVVFLMFVIGLEFNLPKLRAMRGHVFGLGLFQVAHGFGVVAQRQRVGADHHAHHQVTQHRRQLERAAGHHADHGGEQVKQRELKRGHAPMLARDRLPPAGCLYRIRG